MSRAIPQGGGPGLSALLLLMVSAAAIVDIFIDHPLLLWPQLVGIAGFLILEFPRVTMMSRFLIVMSFGLVAVENLTGQFDPELTAAAIGRAAFMVFFLNSLSFLQHAAGRSPMLARSGEVLVHQPPGRRYLVLTFGASLFGMLLNLGTVSLLGTMIRKGIAPGTDDEGRRIAAIRLRRMTLAMLRGFSTVPMWSPITVTIVIITTAVPEVSWAQIVIYSAPLAVVFMLLGWLADRRSHRRATAPAPHQTPSLAALLPLLLLAFAVPGSAWVLSRILGTSMVAALLLSLPVLSSGWIYIQERSTPGAVTRTRREVTGRILPGLPAMRTEITLFACSVFLGALITDIIDTEALGQAITGFGLSSGVTLAASAWLIAILAVIGVNPIVSATIIAGTLPRLGALDLDPVAVGFMLVSIWTVSVNATPFGASVRLASRVIEKPPAEVGLAWNGRYAFAMLCLLTLILLAFG